MNRAQQILQIREFSEPLHSVLLQYLLFSFTTWQLKVFPNRQLSQIWADFGLGRCRSPPPSRLVVLIVQVKRHAYLPTREGWLYIWIASSRLEPKIIKLFFIRTESSYLNESKILMLHHATCVIEAHTNNFHLPKLHQWPSRPRKY